MEPNAIPAPMTIVDRSSILCAAAILFTDVEAFHGIYHPPCWKSNHSRFASRSSASAESNSGDQTEPSSSSSAAHLIFPGGGIYFYWQAGVVTFLRENAYNLQETLMTGASAGALTATLASTGVDFYKAMELALSLADRSGVWNRNLGLQGIWGELIYEWLDELIPNTAVATDLYDGKLSLLVTKVPHVFDKKLKVSSFRDKNDLIEANMASIHIPWFLDSQFTTTFRGMSVIDGSFLVQPQDYYYDVHNKDRNKNIVLDYKMDPLYRNQNILSFIETVEPSKIRKMLEDGRRYAKRLEEQGYFEALSKL